MSNAIVTLLLVILSDDDTVSARQQRMTFAECRAEMREAASWLKSNEMIAGGCILTAAQEREFFNGTR
jgi:hypothetical protein